MWAAAAAAVLWATSASGVVWGDDEFTLYELLAPDTHRFAITYDVTTSKEGDRFFLNPIRPGSIASDERVEDRATGKPLRFEVVSGKQARAAGLTTEPVKDEDQFVKVELASPVPKGGERRIRIFKTYTDPKSYTADGDRVVFERGLFIRRNAVLLPAGYELVASSVPAIAALDKDGRVKVSFVNDRDDALPVKVVGRRLPAAAAAPAPADFHRADQDREITYWLLAPETGQFRISHDFTVTRPGQASVHSFVRKGSTVSQATVVDLDTGETLKTTSVAGKAVNALGYYPEPAPDDSVVVQADLPAPLAEGQSVRVRVIETYTDSERYYVKDGELVWDRTLGRPFDEVILPSGWRLTSVSVPAIVSVDSEGRVACRFVNPRNDEIHVVLKGRRRP